MNMTPAASSAVSNADMLFRCGTTDPLSKFLSAVVEIRALAAKSACVIVSSALAARDWPGVISTGYPAASIRK
jgi:hypothetical protein